MTENNKTQPRIPAGKEPDPLIEKLDEHDPATKLPLPSDELTTETDDNPDPPHEITMYLENPDDGKIQSRMPNQITEGSKPAYRLKGLLQEHSLTLFHVQQETDADTLLEVYHNIAENEVRLHACEKLGTLGQATDSAALKVIAQMMTLGEENFSLMLWAAIEDSNAGPAVVFPSTTTIANFVKKTPPPYSDLATAIGTSPPRTAWKMRMAADFGDGKMITTLNGVDALDNLKSYAKQIIGQAALKWQKSRKTGKRPKNPSKSASRGGQSPGNNNTTIQETKANDDNNQLKSNPTDTVVDNALIEKMNQSASTHGTGNLIHLEDPAAKRQKVEQQLQNNIAQKNFSSPTLQSSQNGTANYILTPSTNSSINSPLLPSPSPSSPFVDLPSFREQIINPCPASQTQPPFINSLQSPPSQTNGLTNSMQAPQVQQNSAQTPLLHPTPNPTHPVINPVPQGQQTTMPPNINPTPNYQHGHNMGQAAPTFTPNIPHVNQHQQGTAPPTYGFQYPNITIDHNGNLLNPLERLEQLLRPQPRDIETLISVNANMTTPNGPTMVQISLQYDQRVIEIVHPANISRNTAAECLYSHGTGTTADAARNLLMVVPESDREDKRWPILVIAASGYSIASILIVIFFPVIEQTYQ